jgi:GntR family transcriptional regulator
LSSRLSIIQSLQNSLENLISTLKPGDRLPSEPKLASQLGVSRATLREAMRIFETQGVIYRRQGSGTYVLQSSPVIESGLEVLESIETLARRIGLNTKLGEMQIQSREANQEECQALRLDEGTKVVVVSRIIRADGKSAAYLVDILPEDILSTDELTDQFSGSVLDLIIRRGFPQLASSRCEINAVDASAEIAHALGIQRGDALLRFVAWLYAYSGQVVDYSKSYFLPGYFRFHVVRRVGRA